MTGRVLTLRELNRATLARQLLLERSGRPLLEAIEGIAGLQAQNVASPYVGLWSRLADFAIEDLRRLILDRMVVKATLMRGTLHLVSTEDFVHFAAAVLPLLLGVSRYRMAPPEVLDPIVAELLAHAAEPRTGPELRARLAAIAGADELDHLAVFWAARSTGPLIQAPPSGVWGHSGAASYVHARAWLGRGLGDPAAGMERLLRSYLAAFGPATIADIRDWTGLNAAAFKEALASLEPDLVRHRNERGQVLLDLAGAPLPDGDTPAPVRLLPMWDSLLLGHADRTRVLSDAHRRVVIHKNGDVQRTFLVDGRVAGIWTSSARAKAAQITFEPFADLVPLTREELAAEGERLLSLIHPDRGQRLVSFREPA